MYMYSNSIIIECHVKEVYSIYCSITFLYLFDLSCIVNHLFMMTYEFIMNVYSVIRGVATPINFNPLTMKFPTCVPVIYKAKFTDSNFLHNYDDEVVIILLL